MNPRTARELIAELEMAHAMIRIALGLMDADQRLIWGMRNAAAGVDGEGITRAIERAAVIASAKRQLGLDATGFDRLANDLHKASGLAGTP